MLSQNNNCKFFPKLFSAEITIFVGMLVCNIRNQDVLIAYVAY